MELLDLLGDLTPAQVAAAVRRMTPDAAQAVLDATHAAPLVLPGTPLVLPGTPLAQAQALDPLYRDRPHLRYLSNRLAAAMEDVEKGISRYMVVSMPPREGKSQLASVYLPLWVLARHPNWPVGIISHDPSLAVKWGRDIRAMVEEKKRLLGVTLAKDAGAAGEWETTEKGGVLSRSWGQSITGRGFKVLLVDDAVKDYADAHSETKRESLWNWWTANARTRQNGPWLVVFIGTRWHEDDLLGRIQNPEYGGDPAQWEIIRFPAIAEDHDVLGRAPGEPLLSPLMEETPAEALTRWEDVKRSVGTYAWSSIYQQSPSPARGAIFDADWWRFWTTNPANVTEDGKVVLLDPALDLRTARWLDSWDMAFKATSSSDYVVGQRWAQQGARRYLMYQERARRTFTVTRARMKVWGDHADPSTPFAAKVHERLVEDKANGTAILDELKDSISGLIAVNPTESKEARARAVTPECEAGNVFLPYPGDPGNEWVTDLLSEFREFPNGAHDDQVDSATQALSRMRTPVRGSIANPNNVATLQGRRRGQVALAQTGSRRYR